MGNSDADWRKESKCRNLTPKEADALFFPGRGGKSNKAKAFCRGCPVIDICLQEALQHTFDGFQAGTTEEERQEIRSFLNLVPVPIEWFIPVPKNSTNPRGRRPKQPVPRRNELNDPLYGVNGPSPQEEAVFYYESLTIVTGVV